MKKLLNTILLLLAPLSLFATDQYTLGWNNPSTTYTVANGSSPVNIWGNTVWLTANQTAGLSMSVVNVNNLNLSDYTLNYVVRASDGSYSLGTLGDLNGIGDSFSVGTVNATDSISFFVSSDAYGTYNAWVSNAGWVNTSIDYVIQSGQWSNGTVTVRIAATASTPAGQPLPGVLTSLMIGGAIGGFYLRRKQKAA